MKRWVIVTDREMPRRDFKGQVQPAQLPSPDRYDVDDWLEVEVNDAEPRLVWRLRCVDVPLA